VRTKAVEVKRPLFDKELVELFREYITTQTGHVGA
jgi:hypothetical protein